MATPAIMSPISTLTNSSVIIRRPRSLRESAIEEQHARAVDEERADRRRNRPDGEARRLDVNAVLVEKAANEQDRADRDEDVLAEEDADVVGRRGVRANPESRRIVDLAEPRLRRRLGHRRDERPHHLRLPAERRQPERRGELANGEVDEQQAARSSRRECCETTMRARSLSPARSRSPITGSASQTDGTDAAVDERLAERRDDVGERVAGGEARGDRRGDDDRERIESQGEPRDDDQDADERKHARFYSPSPLGTS